MMANEILKKAKLAREFLWKNKTKVDKISMWRGVVGYGIVVQIMGVWGNHRSGGGEVGHWGWEANTGYGNLVRGEAEDLDKFWRLLTRVTWVPEARVRSSCMCV